MAARRVDDEGRPDQGPDVVSADRAGTLAPTPPELPATRGAPEGELAAAVDEAVIGEVFADLPEAQPGRALSSATDVSSLYIRHRSGLAAHARRFLRDSRDVDEVVQETFLRLFLAMDEIDTELQAIAFARRTLTNLCIDRYRADRRRPTLVNLEAAPVGELATDAGENDPVLRAEDAAIVREALARLSPLHRAALVKREIEEKSLPQIAAELDIAEESVKHLLFRARRALRRLLVGTSVEPGVDLTVGEIASLANRRAAEALMRGANVFIVLVVGAIVAAVGMRALEGRTPVTPVTPASTGSIDQGQQATGAVSGTVSGAGSNPKAARPRHPVQLHVLPQRREAHHTPTPVVQAPSVVPVQHAPISSSPMRPTGGGFGAARGHFRLSGPLQVKGTPRVEQPIGTVTSDDGVTTTAVSDFVADTSEGTFQLAQSVSTSDQGNDSVSVTPSFVVGNAVETPTMTGSSASVTTNPDGSVAVDLDANVTPDPSSNAFPLSAVSVQLELTPDLRTVVSESVVLSSAAPATPPQATVPTAGPTAAPTSVPTSPAQPPAIAGGGSDTDSGSPPGGQASTPGVLEISDMSGDDREAARSF